MSSCSANPHAVPSTPLPEISVDGITIDETTFANELQYHADQNFDRVIQQAGQALVIRQLLLTKAKQLDLLVDEQEESAISTLLQQQVTYTDPDEATCQRYFANNPDKFLTMPLMEVDHILLAAAKDDYAGRDAAKLLAVDLIKQLQADPKLFKAFAELHSACPSKAMGGSLGQISKGQTVPEFERQLMRLPQGLAMQPIESRYGLHIVHIARKIEGKPLEYVMVADKVRGYLMNRASHLAIQAYIQTLVEQADIQGIELMFSDENIVK
jgi:peptidyl-prolyl cis-trans isomerase C